MASPVQRRVAFIRAIGGPTHATMPLADLCKVCMQSGLQDVTSVIATGNLLFSSTKSEASCRAVVVKAIASFGLELDVFIRHAGDTEKVLNRNPFADAAELRPNHLIAFMVDADLSVDAARQLELHAGPERIRCFPRLIYIDYVAGVGASKIMPGVIERRLKLKGTARNWNTMRKVHGLLSQTS